MLLSNGRFNTKFLPIINLDKSSIAADAWLRNIIGYCIINAGFRGGFTSVTLESNCSTGNYRTSILTSVSFFITKSFNWDGSYFGCKFSFSGKSDLSKPCTSKMIFVTLQPNNFNLPISIALFTFNATLCAKMTAQLNWLPKCNDSVWLLIWSIMPFLTYQKKL